MRIIFMGTPEFAVSSLEAIAADHEVAAVFTRRDAPKNRGMKLLPPPVKVCAEKLGIPVYQPVSLKNGKWLPLIRELAPDVIVVAAYGKLLPPEILQAPKYGCLNVHASLLPKYRGASPINAAILNGEKTAGVTVMQMAEGLDTGDMLLRGSLEIGEAESFGSLHDRLATLGAEIIVRALADIGGLCAEKQDDALSTYAPMIKTEDTGLNFSQSAEMVSRRIRAFDPQPGAFCFLDGVKCKLYSAALLENGSENEAGKIISCNKNGFTVACAKGTFLLSEMQLAGGKKMPASAFYAGHKDAVGKSFENGER